MNKKFIYVVLVVLVTSLMLTGCKKKNIVSKDEGIENLIEDGNEEENISNLKLPNTGKSKTSNGLIINDISLDGLEEIQEDELNQANEPVITPDIWSHYYQTEVKEDGNYDEITKITTPKQLEEFMRERPDKNKLFGFKDNFFDDYFLYVINVSEQRERYSLVVNRATIENGEFVINTLYDQVTDPDFKYSENAFLCLTIAKDIENEIKNVHFLIDEETQEELKERRLEKENKLNDNVN